MKIKKCKECNTEVQVIPFCFENNIFFHAVCPSCGKESDERQLKIGTVRDWNMKNKK